MRRSVKVKAAARLPLRKTPTSASAAARRNFPAWVVATEGANEIVAARSAKPRLRAGLVLRTVTQTATERRVSDAPRRR